ncbi:MAG: hypothetical protein M9918_19300 [Anaerolineae bacterium]|nr:hypothetical protein [Anaerolineae bacterium]
MPQIKRSLFAFLFFVSAAILVGISEPQTAHAQTCAYADIINQSDLDLDTAAVCAAAQPWAQDGYKLLIFLTDTPVRNETVWFDLIDGVEASVGLRDLSQTDAFDTNGLAFEAATSADWATSITFGDSLFNTALDNDTAINALKRTIRGGINTGDPTIGFVNALTNGYVILNPPTAQTNNTVSSPSVTNPETSAENSSNLLPIIGIILVIGGVAFAMFYLWPHSIRPALEARRHRQALQEHLSELQQRVANLLLACERLLEGNAVSDTVLYQLFEAYGGTKYDPLDEEVTEWLRRSREALSDAFDLRTRLVRPGVAEQRSLEQLVGDWESIYVTIVGTTEHITSLSDDDLHTLLDPMDILEGKPDDVRLASQLDSIRNELIGVPLRVELMIIDPSTLDAEGILGYVADVQEQIGRLQAAQRDAPDRLQHAQDDRQASEEAIPDPFVIAETHLFSGIDARLAAAATKLQDGVYLRVLDEVAIIEDDLDTLDELVATVTAQTKRDNVIDDITNEGFRPPHLTQLRDEMAADLHTIEQKLRDDNFDSVRSWIDEYNADGEAALAHAQTWRDLYKANAAYSAELHASITQLEPDLLHETPRVWQQLQTYPALNWQDLQPGMTAVTDTATTAHDRLQHATTLNTLANQQFETAQHLLVTLGADLAAAELHMETVLGRLTAVVAAERTIDSALSLTEQDLSRARTLRDAEDRKIGPEVDAQLIESQTLLETARRHRRAREFLAAQTAQEKSRELATAAYQSADAQIAHINALLLELETIVNENDSSIKRMLQTVEGLDAVVISESTLQMAQKAARHLAEAQEARAQAADKEDHALAAALESAITNYRTTLDLAQRAHAKSRQDQEQYDALFDKANSAIDSAEDAIRRAAATGSHRSAGNSWRELVRKAQQTIPEMPNRTMTRDQLQRIYTAAATAQQLALKANAQAANNIEMAQRRALATSTRLNRSFGSSRSSSRSRSSNMRSSSSFRSSSRRSSSSSSSSSRRSSFGSSRRR